MRCGEAAAVVVSQNEKQRDKGNGGMIQGAIKFLVRMRVPILGFILFGCLVLFLLRDPVYQGRSLVFWFDEYALRGRGDVTVAAFREHRGWGTRFLVKEMQREESTWNGFYRRVAPRLPAPLRRWLPSSVGRVPNPAEASRLLGEMGFAARSTVPELVRIIVAQEEFIEAHSSSDPKALIWAATLEYRAVYALGRIGGESPAMVSALINVRQYPRYSVHVVNESARALQNPALRRALRASVPFLTQTALMSRRDSDAHDLSMVALAQLTAEVPEVTPLLVKLLKAGPLTANRTACIRGLACSWNDYEEVVPLLVEMLPLDRTLVALDALQELSRRTDLVVVTLRETLKNSDPIKRTYAAFALGELGAKAQPAAPDLIEALDDADVDVQAAAKRALKLMEAKTAAEARKP